MRLTGSAAWTGSTGTSTASASPAILKTLITALLVRSRQRACRQAHARLPMQQGTTGLSTVPRGGRGEHAVPGDGMRSARTFAIILIVHLCVIVHVPDD